jgi:3-methyladenine DNA glycosylase AlkD
VKQWPVAERDRFVTELWKSGMLEEGVLVAHIYRRFGKSCGEREFRMFEQWLDRYVRNWSHCDGVSAWLIAASIANQPGLADRLARWTKSKNRWKRRSAAVSLIQEAKRGTNTETIFHICGLLLEDSDDMVQKGVGWLLKETYPKRPREVLDFLDAWRTRAPRLVLRIAAEKMTPKHKRWLMKR